MKIEIDQSGKVEQSSFATVLADSLGNSVLLRAKTKRLLQQKYRLSEKPRMFVIETFAFMLARLIQLTYNPQNHYVIDREYYGRENEIKAALFRILQRRKVPIEKTQISFGIVGKKSKAHLNAYRLFKEPKNYSKHEIPLKDIVVFGP